MGLGAFGTYIPAARDDAGYGQRPRHGTEEFGTNFRGQGTASWTLSMVAAPVFSR
jgi:hypothetical protein